MSRTPVFSWVSKRFNQALNQQFPERYRLTRRQFLKTAVAGVTYLALRGHEQQGLAKSLKLPASPVAPVAIVGGGVAGLVTAYRLMKRGIPCQLFEASSRLGGRMFTQARFNEDEMFCELGGELVDSIDFELIDLCQELGVPLEDFRTADQDLVSTLYYFENCHWSEAEVIEAFKPLAVEITQDMASLFPDGEGQIPTYDDPADAEWLDQLSLEAYLDSKQNIAPWLIRLIKIAYTGEYGLEPSEQSALNLLLLIRPDTENGFAIYGESDEAMRIAGGSSRLTEVLAARLESAVPICRNHSLVAIEDTGRYFTLTFQQGRQTVQHQAERVVLAIPFTVLREVRGVFDLNLSEVKKKCIAELGYGTNSKRMLDFSIRFWRTSQAAVPASAGSIFTDLPVQAFWETSRLQAGQHGILTNFLGGDAAKSSRSDDIDQVLSDMSQIYDMPVEPYYTGKQAFFNWSLFPLAKGSYSCFKPGQYTSIGGVAGKPELNHRLFFAGEHCSVNWGGYMNGAVESGNFAAELVMGQLAQQAETVSSA